MSRLHFDLGKLGTAQGSIPTSLATCWAFLSAFRNSNDAQKLYLNAAAIGACNQTDKLPRYPYEKGDPLSYGFQIADLLMESGITPARIIELGDPALAQMFERSMGMFQAEVTEKENFSSQSEAD